MSAPSISGHRKIASAPTFSTLSANTSHRDAGSDLTSMGESRNGIKKRRPFDRDRHDDHAFNSF